MSTLTKIVAVLLTLSAIFLCGIVATYVATAESWKEQYDNLKHQYDAAVAKKKNADKLLEQEQNKYRLQEEELKTQVAALNIKIESLNGELQAAEREKKDLLLRVNDLVTALETASQTANQQTRLFENAQTDLAAVRADLITESQALKERTDELIEKMAIIDTLTAQKKQLDEKTSELLRQLDQQRRPVAIETVPPRVVTPEPTMVQPVPPVVEPIGLQGSVTAVDLKNSLAEISIGQAHGVKESMRFHVLRGDEFVCDLLIFFVDAERSVGILERVRSQPRAGDNVATNL
ncbi:MAG: hypothetical protein ACYS9T_04110 [Planctomycetota bacterium]